MKETPTSKHQAPEKLQLSSFKPGISTQLEFGAWIFSGAWSLGFGASSVADIEL
jgi:hypothetical protein